MNEKEVEQQVPPFISRILEEKSALIEKINKLNDFLNSDKKNNLLKQDLILLYAQINIMFSYKNVLDARLERFNISTEVN